MFDQVRRILAAPAFADPEKTRLARMLNLILLIILALVVVYGIVTLFTVRDLVNTAIEEGTIALLCLGLIALMRSGRVRLSAFLLSLVLWGVISVGSWFSGGLRGSGMSSYFGIILIAGLLMGGRGGIAFGGLSIVSAVVMLYGETSGLMPPVPSRIDSTYLLIEFGTVVIGVVGLFYLATYNLTTTLKRARSNEQAQSEANRELQALRDSLEERIAERTRDLERRSTYLETAAEVGRASVSILEVGDLVRQVTELIRQRFDLHAVMLFILDETGRWAELDACSSKADRLVPESALRLQVGGDSPVGWCIANAHVRVVQGEHRGGLTPGVVPDFAGLDLADGAQDASVDGAHRPATIRSEVALPLVARGRVIGALSVQSAEADAFDQDVIGVLQTIADQVAVALDNARLRAESEVALEAERRAYGEIDRQAWLNLVRAGLTLGYSYAGQQLTPIYDPPPPELSAALQKGRNVWVEEQASRPVLAVPIQVRDQMIGVVDLQKPVGGGDWTEEETTLLQAIVEQLGVALEGARLYQDTQRRAAQEQLVGQVTGRIRESLDVETVLKTTASEIRRALDLDTLVIRLATPETDGASRPA